MDRSDSADARRYRLLQRFQQLNSRSWEDRSIYKVPSPTRNLNFSAYEPRVVSIGPYHYGKEHLDLMEAHKYRALQHFLMVRGWGLTELVGDFENAEVLRSLRSSYASPLEPEWDDDHALASLVVLDGCFLVELLLTNCRDENSRLPERLRQYDDHDPIFGMNGEQRHGILAQVKVDLLLVENQLPLWVLGRLAQISDMTLDFNWLIRELYGTNPADALPQSDSLLGIHFLDVYRSSRLLSGDYTGWTAPFGAQELRNCGIHIQPNSGNGSFKDVTFSKTTENWVIIRGMDMAPLGYTVLDEVCNLFIYRVLNMLLPIPTADLTLSLTAVDESTETVLLNLMAFEQLHVGRSKSDMGVSLWVLLMGSLLRSEEDVKILRETEVLTCVPERGDGEVAAMFARLTRGMTVAEGRGMVNAEMKEVCKKKVGGWLVASVRYYWRKDFDPLKTRLTMLAALYGFLITLASFILSVVSYFHARKPVVCVVK